MKTKRDTQFYKGFIKEWQSSNTRQEAQAKLISRFPEENFSRRTMMNVKNYIEKRGVALKNIPPDPKTDWSDVKNFASNL